MKYLGLRVKDQITGFEGTATAFIAYLAADNQYLVEASVGKDNKDNSRWVSEGRLAEVVAPKRGRKPKAAAAPAPAKARTKKG